MAVESIGPNVSDISLDNLRSDPVGASLSKTPGGKISPEAETVMIDSFLASMITNQLQLNSQLFDFAKEAINEADSE